jgi:dTMP kinase
MATMPERGYFIVFEGVDGAGKSTQIEILSEKLRRVGVDHVIEQEPSGGAIGKFIRDYAEAGDRWMMPETEALLFTADRVEHVKRIDGILSQGVTVLCDRFMHSTLAYQGASGVDIGWLRSLQQFPVEPDLIILFDLDPDRSLVRVSGRSLTVFENNSYLRKVRELYLGFAEAGEMTRIDTGRTIDEIEADVAELVSRKLGLSL